MTRGLNLVVTDAGEAHLYATEEPGEAVRPVVIPCGG